MLLLKCFTPDQSAFLKGHSTQTARHKVVDDLLESTDGGLVSCLCFFDIKKCFDCIQHQVLLHKMTKYGILGLENKWFHSCLSDRQQITIYNNVTSEPLPVTMGIPQGSVLGPALFLLFINDLTCAIKHSIIDIYADDTLIYVSDENVDKAAFLLQSDIDHIIDWFEKNKLTISVEKSFVMYVASKQRLGQLTVLPKFKAKNQFLHLRDGSTYLGMIIDQNLSWEEHISHLCKKLRPKVGMFFRLRHILSPQMLKTVYFTLVQSLIDYGITIWGSANQTNIKSVQRLQSRCARLLTGYFYHDISSLVILSQLGLLNVKQRYSFFICIMVYKSLNDSMPNHICDTLTFLRDCHNHDTRNELLLKIPFSRSSYGKRTFANVGSCLWNNLPNVLKSSHNISTFRKNLHNFLLS